MTRTARRSPRQITVTGKVDGLPVGRLLIATDASGVGRTAMFATGYVATSGHYGADARPTPPGVTGRSDILIAELRAIHRALSAVRKDNPEDRATVLCDNRDAVDWVRPVAGRR